MTDEINKKEWLSPEEAAEHIGVSLATIYRYLNEIADPIPSYKLAGKSIRIKRTELDQWIIKNSNKQ